MSIVQLVRSSVIVFVALYRIVLSMPPPFKRHHFLGILLNVIAIIAIGSSALVDPASGSNIPLGIGLLLLACSIMAAQIVIEEKLMTGAEIPPLIVVGMEGFWGMVVMFFIIFPVIAQLPGNDVGGVYENLSDTLAIMRDPENGGLRIMTCTYIASITGYNVSSIFITFLLGSMCRSIFLNFRPVAVWVTDLAIFYCLTGGEYGESWTVWSWLQLGGMCVLILGTLIYNKTISLSWITNEKDEEVSFEDKLQLEGVSPLILKAISPSGTPHHAFSPSITPENAKYGTLEMGQKRSRNESI